MAYRVTKDKESSEQQLVIDGWENGIADSPYGGITSIKNLNVSFLVGATYVNYKRKPVTLTGIMARPMFYCQTPGTSPTYFILDQNGQVWKGAYDTWTLVTGNHTASGGLGYGIAYYKDYLFVFGTNYIDVCGDGTGVGHITSAYWNDINSSGYYFKNLTAVDMTGAPALGATSLTLTSIWGYTSGIYQVSIGGGAQIVQGTFTHGSATVTIVPAVSITTSTTTCDIALFTLTSPVNHMALVAINDVLYFCNGNTIGSISVPPSNTAAVFKVSDFATQYVNFSALTLRGTDRAVWLAELNQDLLVAVKDYIYAWDKTTTLVNGFPTQVFTATPINEQPSRMINVLNKIYIFAGQKGNIYVSNGYSVSLFKKIPDSFLGVIDPYWVIGGMMFHRNKLWFGVVGGSVGGSVAAQGIMSLVLYGGSSSSANETSGAINFESQNSYGITPTTSADGTSILIDGNSFYGTGFGSSVTTDAYVSAYYNNSVGGIDYNDSTLWANWEPQIETDLIPMGSLLTGGTLAQIEFKLDRPMASGDQFRMSWRPNFTASYTPMGTTTTAVLSDIYDTGINSAQWVQFKVEFKCAASSSSFIPLRQIILHYGY